MTKYCQRKTNRIKNVTYRWSSKQHIKKIFLQGSRIKQDSSLRTNSTWQVDTHMVLPQTKFILIPHHAMPQILYKIFLKAPCLKLPPPCPSPSEIQGFQNSTPLPMCIENQAISLTYQVEINRIKFFIGGRLFAK